jgi:hypothetical protein
MFALGHKISSKYIDLQSTAGDMGIMWNFSRQDAGNAASGLIKDLREDAGNAASGPIN